jgi:uncharacterized membrane protein
VEGSSSSAQPPQGPPNARDIMAGIPPRTASIMCYIPGLGWIASIIVLAADRFRHNRAVRFHGFQGLYLFVAWLLEDQVMRPIFGRIPGMHLHALVQALLLAASIFMMVKAAHDETYALPLFGELAQKSMTEE